MRSLRRRWLWTPSSSCVFYSCKCVKAAKGRRESGVARGACFIQLAWPRDSFLLHTQVYQGNLSLPLDEIRDRSRSSPSSHSVIEHKNQKKSSFFCMHRVNSVFLLHTQKIYRNGWRCGAPWNEIRSVYGAKRARQLTPIIVGTAWSGVVICRQISRHITAESITYFYC